MIIVLEAHSGDCLEKRVFNFYAFSSASLPQFVQNPVCKVWRHDDSFLPPRDASCFVLVSSHSLFVVFKGLGEDSEKNQAKFVGVFLGKLQKVLVLTFCAGVIYHAKKGTIELDRNLVNRLKC